MAYIAFLIVLAEGFGQVAMWILSGQAPAFDRGASAELFVQHPYLVGAPRPGAGERRGDVSVSINEAGFRASRERASTESPGLTILALGGSTTFGTRVGDEDTWPHRLEQVLDSLLEGTGHVPVRVINAGVPGYTSIENVIQLATVGADLDPDLVVLFQGINDLHTAHSPNLKPDYSDFHGPSQWTNLELHRLKRGNRSALVRVARSVLQVAFQLDRPRPATGPRSVGMDRRAEEIYTSNLTSFTGLCAAHGLECLFAPQVLGPGSRDLWWFRFWEAEAIEPALTQYNQVMERVAKNTGTSYLETILSYDWTAVHFADGQHFSPIGNQAFADIVAARISTLLIDAAP